MRDGLEQLKSVMLLLHEEEAAGDTVDWGVAATELGVPSFPSDYRDFVTSFGAGSIEDSVYVWVPRPGTTGAPLTVGRLPASAVGSESMRVWQGSEAGSRHRLEDMLVWGQTSSADALCWVASDLDPDNWPVAVWERQGGGWQVHDVGMVEFLLGLLRGTFPTCPVSDETLWRVRSARFLNFRDEERSLDAGVDPWTGRRLNRFD
ncbi:SMI1/KNR4 family protein [Streptomyces hawaiiensis]